MTTRKLLIQLAIATALVAGCILLWPAPSKAAPADALRLYAGANAVWLDGPGAAWPADFEASGNAAASLSPHLTLTGSLAYGFSHSYVRWNAGPAVTVTDVDNPNLSVDLGIGYRGGSTNDVNPNEWAPYTAVGWRPNPAKWPNVLLGGRAGLGLTSNRTLLTLGVRYSIPLK